MGIATSTGVIRDFAGPYHVSEDNMAFGKPTKYWQLDYTKAKGGVQGWDVGVAEASEIYKTRMVIKRSTKRKNKKTKRKCFTYTRQYRSDLFAAQSMLRQLPFARSESLELDGVRQQEQLEYGETCAPHDLAWELCKVKKRKKREQKLRVARTCKTPIL